MSCDLCSNVKEPTAFVKNLNVIQGSTFEVAADINVDGSPMDATWSARGQVRRSAADPTIAYTLAITVAEPRITITIPAVDSTAWDWTCAVYDVEIFKTVSSVEVVYRVMQGHVVVGPEVTR